MQEDCRRKRQQLTPVARLAGLFVAGQVTQAGAALQLMLTTKMDDCRQQQHSDSHRNYQCGMVLTFSRNCKPVSEDVLVTMHSRTSVDTTCDLGD